MDFYQNPIGGVPDPYEGYRPERAGEGGKGGGPPDDEPPRKKGALLAYFLRVLQKKLGQLLELFGNRPAQKQEKSQTLGELKGYLEVLEKEDRSQDVDFLNDLSKCWNRAIEESVGWGEKRALLFQILAKKILHYPEDEPHTFGYYLTEYAGQKWVPFPYMELVQKIHLEHEKNPSGSALLEWVRLLDDCIRS